MRRERTGIAVKQGGFRLAFRRGDLLAVALVLLLAAASALAFVPRADNKENSIVQVYMDGALVREYPLDADRTEVIVGAYSNTLTIENGRAAITKSDCPGADCVHSGWIDGAGRSIVCLPNRVEIRITGESEVDFTVR